MKSTGRKAAPAKLYFGKYRGTVAANDDPQRQGRIRVRVPEVLGQTMTAWAVACVPYAGKRAGFHAIPAEGTTVFVEFEAGDLARPIWTGALWDGPDVPPDERSTPATPAVKILRSEQGLLVALHDDQNRIAISDSAGTNLLTIDVQRGVITIKAAQRVVIDAPVIDLSSNARHPAMHGDTLFTYLNQLVVMFNSHVHQGQSPPLMPLLPPTPGMLSLKVRLD